MPNPIPANQFFGTTGNNQNGNSSKQNGNGSVSADTFFGIVPGNVSYSPNASISELYKETQPTQGYFSSVMSQYASLPDKLVQDVEAGASDIEKSFNDKTVGQGFGDFAKGVAKAGLRTAGDSALAIFAPVTEAIGQVVDKTGAQALIQKGANEIVGLTGVADSPTVQKWAMAHPNAADDFSRALALIMSGGDKTDIAKNVSDDVTSLKKGASQISQGQVPTDITTALQKVVKYSSDIKSFVQNATADDTSKRAVQNMRYQNGVALDAKTAALQNTTEAESLLKTAQDKQQSLSDQKQALIDQKESELKQHQADLESKTKQLADTKTQSAENIAKLKDENEAKIKATTDAYNEKLKENAAKQRQALAETQKAQNDFKAKQDQLNQAEEQHKNQVNDSTAKTKDALKQSGYPDEQTMRQQIAALGQKAFKWAGSAYQALRGTNATLDSSSIIDAMSDYKRDALGAGKLKTADSIQLEIDKLKLGQMMSEYKGDSSELYQQIEDEGINKKLLRDPSTGKDMTPEQLQERYRPITSGFFKDSRNALYDRVESGAEGESSVQSYNEKVVPAIDNAFNEAYGNKYGQDALNKLKATDAQYSALKSNSVFDGVMKGETPSLKTIQDNWNQFVSDASKIPADKDAQGNPIQGTSGADIVKKVQSSIGSQILDNADRLGNGQYNVDDIQKGLKKYGSILGDDVKNTLQSIVDMHNQLKESDEAAQDTLKQEQEATKRSAQETKSTYDEQQRQLKEQKSKDVEAEKTKASQAESDLKKQQDIEKSRLAQEKQSITDKSKLTEKELNDFKDQKAKIEADKKSIAKDPVKFLQQMNGIKSVDDWNEYLDKTGKTPDEVRPVLITTLLKNSGFEVLGRNTNFNFDNLGDFFRKVNNLGGGDVDVQKEMLGQKGINALDDLKDEYDKYEKLKTTKGRTLASSALRTAFHVFLAAGGLGFGRFFGIRGLMNDFGLGAKEEPISGKERTPQPSQKASAKPAIKYGVLDAVANQQNKKKQ